MRAIEVKCVLAGGCRARDTMCDEAWRRRSNMTGRDVAVEEHRLEADGSSSNNPELPLRVYRGA